MQYPIVNRQFIKSGPCNSVVESHRYTKVYLSEIVENKKIVLDSSKRKSKTRFTLYKHSGLEYIRMRVDKYMLDSHRVHNSSIQMTTYESGDFFSSHIDALEKYQLKQFGPQRLWTAILYLDDDCVGGETCFPFLKTCIQPEKGTLLCWPNVDNDGNIIRIHRHYSKQITDGEKNILIFLYYKQIVPELSESIIQV
tara:strand:+ start:6009 stop:6596 length:588 start_codon:yes stop_codon:yes gene_type:complete